MSRIREETVIRHPCIRFDTDSLGETSRPIFGEPVEVEGARVAYGGSSEPSTDTDAPVDAAVMLFFRHRRITSGPYDDWTVRGLRYQQEGVGQQWPLGTVIELTRRTG